MTQDEQEELANYLVKCFRRRDRADAAAERLRRGLTDLRVPAEATTRLPLIPPLPGARPEPASATSSAPLGGVVYVDFKKRIRVNADGSGYV